MKSMKKILSGEPTSPILECGEAQLQAALTMEARSRTPLPPSPVSQHLQEPVLSTVTQLEKLKLKQTCDSAMSIQKKNCFEKPSISPKPFKPPRKYTPSTKTVPVVDDPHYEPVERSYDEVEYRSNAWQTMGIDSPNHTEQVNLSA